VRALFLLVWWIATVLQVKFGSPLVRALFLLVWWIATVLQVKVGLPPVRMQHLVKPSGVELGIWGDLTLHCQLVCWIAWAGLRQLLVKPSVSEFEMQGSMAMHFQLVW